jgi:sugar phosphate isomerase/epimerase
MKPMLGMNTGTFTLKEGNLGSMLEAIGRAGFKGVDFRDAHLDAYVAQGHPLEEIPSLLQKNGLSAVSISAIRVWQQPQGLGQGKSRDYLEDYFRKAKTIGCETLICATLAEDADLERDTRNFQELCRLASLYDLKIALEFLPWAGICDVLSAWRVVQASGCSNAGLLVDSFHFFKGGSQIPDLVEIPTEKILMVHLCDAPAAGTGLKEMCMKHRLFPGEVGSTLPLRDFLDMLFKVKKYEGPIILEVLKVENENMDYFDICMRGQESFQKI